MPDKSNRLEPRSIRENYHGTNRYYILGNKCREEIVCKYMDLETAEKCLENGTIRFIEPKSWKDPYEKLFYFANYKKELGWKKNMPTLLATCITPTTSCEAAWKVYTYGKTEGKKGLCTQFVFDFEALRKELLANIPSGLKMYEGKVTYRQTSTINKLRTIDSYLFKRFFSSELNIETCLSLMLIKRPAYRYENEIRIFLYTENESHQFKKYNSSKYIDIKIDFAKCLKKIVVDEKATKDQLSVIKNRVKKLNIKTTKHKLYNEVVCSCFLDQKTDHKKG